MKAMLNRFLEIIAPERCVACGAVVSRDRSLLCGKCYDTIAPVGERCRRCSGPVADGRCLLCHERAFYLSVNRAVAEYRGVMKKMLGEYKFNRKRRLYRHFVAVAEREAEPSLFRCDLVSCVPLEGKNSWRRGYNQSELVALALAKRHGLPYARLLERCVAGKGQKYLGSRERYFNILGAFKVKKRDLFKGKSLLLVDDVFTTGATINECARVLLEAGAREVSALTLARAVDSIAAGPAD